MAWGCCQPCQRNSIIPKPRYKNICTILRVVSVCYSCAVIWNYLLPNRRKLHASANMKLSICLLVAFLAIVHGKPQRYEDPAEPYTFQYKVDNPPTNTFFGQNESGDQTGAKTGSYYVLLPDGRTMTVDYRADEQGFVPKVSFSGSAQPQPYQG